MPITIAVATMQHGAGAIANALNRSLLRGDVEGAGSTHRYPSHIRSSFHASGDDRFDHIARLEAFDALRLFGAGAGKPELVHPAHLA